MALTLRIVGRALLGIDLGGEADRIGPAVTTALEYLEHRLNNLLALPPGVPTPRNLRFRGRCGPLDAVVFEVIAARRRSPVATPATCSRCSWPPATRRRARASPTASCATRSSRSSPPATRRPPSRWPGPSTCSTSTPRPTDRLRAEVADVLGGRTPTAADLPAAGYTRRVIEESLRLYPPVYAVAPRRRARRRDRRLPHPGPVDGHPQPLRHPPPPRVLARPRGVRPRPLHCPSAPPADPGSPGSRSWAGRTSASARSSP